MRLAGLMLLAAACTSAGSPRAAHCTGATGAFHFVTGGGNPVDAVVTGCSYGITVGRDAYLTLLAPGFALVTALGGVGPGYTATPWSYPAPYVASGGGLQSDPSAFQQFEVAPPVMGSAKLYLQSAGMNAPSLGGGSIALSGAALPFDAGQTAAVTMQLSGVALAGGATLTGNVQVTLVTDK